MKATLAALLAAALLPVGCGCRGTTVGSGGTAVLPGGTGADGPTTAVSTTDPGGDGAIVAPPVAPAGGVPEDPTPPRLRAHFDALDNVLETEALHALEKQAEAECVAHPDDAVAWLAAASTVFQRIALTTAQDAKLDLKPVRERVTRARAADRPGTYTYLCVYLDARIAHLEEKGEEAMRGYHETIRLAPGFLRPRLPLAGLLIAAGRPNDGEAVLLETIRLFPDRWEGWDALGTWKASQRKFEEALQACDKARKCAPASFKVRSKLLGLLGLLWRDQPSAALKDRILAEIAEVTALVDGAISNKDRAGQMKTELAQNADTVHASWAQTQIEMIERLPAPERNHAAIFGPVQGFRLRGRLTVMVAQQIPTAPEPAVRLLMEVAAADPHDTVRISALRALSHDPASGRLRSLPERTRVAKLAQELLTALAVAPATPDQVRQNAFQVLQVLPVDPAVAGPPLVAFLELLMAAWPAEGEFDLADYARIQTLGAALQAIRGLGAPAPPPRDAGAEQRATYMAGWKAWAAELAAASGGR